MVGRRWVVVLGASACLCGVLATAPWRGVLAASAATAFPAQESSSKSRAIQAHGFLIRGSVFTDKGMSFPGVELRIRRAGEKKFHWQDASNFRGEFAIRVPPGSEYEMVAHAKGFADQTRTIDAKNGLSEENVVFEMQPLAGGKK